MEFIDTFEVGETHTTSDGYLVGKSKIGRIGTQKYLASEIGELAYNLGFSANDVVNVYRPESEVFSKDTINSLTRIPITLGHPSLPVDSTNWSNLSVGEVGDSVLREGEWVVVNPMIKDERAIKAAKTSHKEFSLGYSANLIARDDYLSLNDSCSLPDEVDFVQQDIVMNHLALVKSARAGSEARILDNYSQEKLMSQNDERLIELVNKNNELKNKLIDNENTIKDLNSVIDVNVKTIEDSNKEIESLKLELTETKEKLVSDEDIQQLVKERVGLINDFTTVVKSKNKKYDLDFSDKSNNDLIKEAVVCSLGEDAIEGCSDEELRGMFKVVLTQSKESLKLEDSKNKNTSIGSTILDSDNTSSAWDRHVANINAWRNKA